MYKILITMVMTGLVVLFGMQNFDHVPVSFIVGSPIKVRLVFLLAMAAACGFLFSYIQGLSREIRLKREIRKLADKFQSSLAKRSSSEGTDD